MTMPEPSFLLESLSESQRELTLSQSDSQSSADFALFFGTELALDSESSAARVRATFFTWHKTKKLLITCFELSQIESES